MPIEALPQTTVRAIGSTSVISDPCSVVKELIDNALDASASSLAVELSTNTIDVIQVKDNGIGILADDYAGVCRHAYTSKIQTIEDLKNVGGSSFGFRGEALASVAEMSGGITVTTRTASDVIGSCIKYGRDGEISQNQRTAHPVGTTVRITDFLKHIPVRRQTVLKGAGKTLTKIKKLLQAYAHAQPACRFSLKVLKAKSESNNWMYAPSPGASISDASVKIVGRDVSSCCCMKKTSSQLEDPDRGDGDSLDPCGYNMTAFLPKPDTDISKINNISQFISLDGRPLSSARGVAFDIVKLFKTYLRSAASKNEGSKAIADPYLCLQLDCPKGSYDVNIEPGKDDVILDDQELVLNLAESLFRDFYGELSSDPKKSPRKAKNASSHAVGAGSGFSILMARKPAQTPKSPTQQINTREPPVGHGEDIPLLISPTRHVPVFPEVHEMGDSQLELRDEDASQMDRNSRFNNPWSITRMNTPRRTPERHGRTSLSPNMRRGAPDSNKAECPLGHTYDSPSNISDVASSGNLRESSGSPLRRRKMPPSLSSPPLRETPLGSNSKRAARERDKERYGNGALDTWFQRTTQISMGHTPLDQPANIDELVPTLSQLAERRFGAEVSPQENEGDPQRPPADIPTDTSHNVESPSSVEGCDIDTNQHSTSMNSGRGYPVLENWAASLKDGFNPDEASGLAWAMDFERRKKEANQRNRVRPVIFDQPTEELAPQSSQGPHQKRFLAAKAALAADRPFATEVTSKQEMNINDPRAYLMLHGSAQPSGDQPEDGPSSRRLRTSRLPFEQIPNGFDLHDVCLPQPTDPPSLSNLITLTAPHDLYVTSGKDTSAFDGPNIRDLVPVWTQRLQSIIARQYKRSDEHPRSDQFDIAGAILSHLQQESETRPVN